MTFILERPGKIICVALNYHSHADESGLPIPERPMVFAKWPNALIGPDQPIVLPSITTKVDFEGELGVVIGARARALPASVALEAVRGYLCVNDVSARDLQKADRQWTRAKSVDSFCPVGPRLVPASEIPDPQVLTIRTTVNGTVMQDATTADMVFSVAEIIAFVSEAITLEPGDLIATGTPSGVGMFRDPPQYLSAGDVVEVDISGIGTLRNPVIGTSE
jgi:2-keto-4-pentenoate hydratase/2-oxohepta-3-ene-1,7-dioic acid hydratase in catechol pathway